MGVQRAMLTETDREEISRDIADFYHLKVNADSVRLVTYLAALQEFGVPDKTIEEALCNHPRVSVLKDRCARIASLPAL